MTDITELAQREKFEAWWEREYKHLESSKYTDAVPHIKYGFWMAYQAGGAELVEALEKAQRAGNINNQWKPDACPITGRGFFMWIEHPELGYVPTYGGPYDSYTIPTRDSDGEFSCERYDHDVGGWVDGECVGAYLIDDDEQCRVYELEQRIDELEPIRAAAEKLVCCKGRYHSEQNYRALAALFGVTTPDLPPLEHENVHYADAADMEIAALRQRIAELESHAVTDWIEHDGKWRPDSLSTDELVYLKTRKQELKIPYPAGKVMGWMHTGGDMDVMAYKLASPQARTVTVKLPDLRQIVSGDRYAWSDGIFNYSQDVKAILADAGIKVEAE